MSHTVTLQIRAGGTKFDANGRLPMLNVERKLGAFLRCAHAGLPAHARDPSVKVGWLLVTDSVGARELVVEELVKTEGEVASREALDGLLQTFQDSLEST